MGIVNKDGALYMATGIDNSGLKKDAEEAGRIIDDIGKKTEDVSQKMQRAKESIDKAFDDAATSPQKYIDSIVAVGSTIEDLSTQAKEQEEIIKTLSTHWDSAMTAMQDAQSKLELGDTSVNKAYVDSLETDFKRLDDALNAAKDNLLLIDKTYSEVLISNNKKVKDQAEQISDSIKKSVPSKEFKVEANEIINGLKSLEQRYKSATKVFSDAMSNDSVKDKLSVYKSYLNELSSISKQIDAYSKLSFNESESNPGMAKAYSLVKTLLKDVNAEIHKEVQNLETANEKSKKQVTILTQIKQVREEMARLRGADGIIAPENINRYEELKVKLKELGTSMNIVSKEQKLLTTAGSDRLAGIIQGITGLSGAFAAGQGIMSLFVKDNEKLAAIQTKLQAAMSITIGLQQVSNTLHATSSFRINTVAKATQLWNRAQTVLNTSLGMGTGLSKAFVSGGIMLLVVAIGYLIAKHKEWNKQQEETKRLNKIVTDSLKEAALEGGKTARKESVSLDLLYKATQNENKSKKERLAAAKEMQKLYPNYFGNLSKEEILAGKGADAYGRLTASILAAAKARAAQDKIVENETKKLDLEAKKAEALTKKIDKEITSARLNSDQSSNSWQTQGTGQVSISGLSKSKIKDDIKELDSEISNYEKEISKLNEANKSLADSIGVTDLLFDPKKEVKALKAEETAAEKYRKEAQEQADARIKAYNELEKADLDYYSSTLENQQKRLDLLEKGFEKEQQQLDINLDKSVLAAEKRVRELVEKQQQAEENAWKAAGSKGVFSPSTKTKDDLFKINPSAKTEYDESLKIAKSTYDKGMKDLYKSQLEMYQDYSAKRVAIEKKFNDDIASLQKAREQAEISGNDELADQLARSIAQATKEKGESLINLDFEQLKKTPEYVRAFENLGNTSTETLNSLLKQLEQAKQAAVQVMTPDQLREYTSTIESIMDELTSRDLLGTIARLKMEVAEADRELIAAEKQYNDVMSGNDTSITTAEATIRLNAAKDNAVKKTNLLRTAEKRLSDQIKQLGQEIENLGNAIGGTVGEIISLMGSITTTVMFAADGIKSVADTSTTAIKTIEKASVILAVISAALQIATKIASLFAADYSEYNKAKEVYESYISVLDKVIAKQKELAGTLTGENAKNSYEYALELIKKQEAAAREIGLQFAGSGSGAGSHSKGRRVWERISGQGWDELAQWNKELSGMAYSAKNVDWLFSQSAEELQRLQETAPTFWAQLGDDIGGYLQAIIDSEKAVKELNEAQKETFTGLSFDSLKDSLDGLIKGADTTFEAIGDSFEDHMRNAVMNFVKSSYLTNALQGWYSKFAEYAGSGTTDDKFGLTPEEISELRKMYEEAYNKAQNIYDSALDAMGVDKNKTDTQASSKGIASISQDSANELNGNFFAQLQKTSDIRNINEASRLLLLGINNGIGDIQVIMKENNKVFQNSLNVQIKIEQNTFRTAEILNKIQTTGIPVSN